MPTWDAWKSFAQAHLLSAPVRETPAPPDPDDFLAPEPAEPAPPPPIPWRSPIDSERARQREHLAHHLDPHELPEAWARLQDGELLSRLDADATWLLCQGLQQTTGLRCTEHGTVTMLLQRAVLSPDPEVAVRAAGAIHALDVREAQASVAERLLADPLDLGRQGVETLLDCLQAIGDGRCVRAMEEVLHRHGLTLDDHHAWRARHIVQSIRRSGRR